MKRLFIAMIVVFMLVVPQVLTANAVSVSFEWSANTEPDMGGYALFQRKDGEAYDYTKPIDPTCTIVDGECWTNPATKKNVFTHTFDVPDGVLTKYYWVARAYDTAPERNWSGDSNEVNMTFDRTPLQSIADFAGVYNKVAQTIDFTWTQGDVARITSWKLYRGTTSGGPYTEILDIPWNGTDTTISASVPADTLAPGEEYYFTVVAFGDGINSPDSNEVKIDRRPPTKVIQLKVTILP